MSDFISEIKKISTDKLIYWLSQQSIKMFTAKESLTQVEIPVVRFGRSQKLCVQLSAWDILNIDYLSVKHSNDYRDNKKKCSPNQLVNLYRDYDNKHSIPERLKNPTHGPNDTFRVILGMTAEQFQYSNLGWIFERFNRNYYILLSAQKNKLHSKIDVDSIVEKTFGFTADDYIAILILVFGLCLKSPLPLTAPPYLYQRTEPTALTQKDLERFIAYYSCSYQELRESILGKQLLYAKPFIKTERTESVIMSNMFSVAMLVGNGLYWVVRDYYKEQGQIFVNAFGRLFEDYIIDLATTYCATSECIHLKEDKKKGADFLFIFNNVQMLIEAKSSLLGLSGKQQNPDSDAIDKFFQRTVQKAYEQLTSSCDSPNIRTEIPIIKIILLYDEFSNTAILEQSIEEIFLNDPTCYIMTIRELEILLYTHQNNKHKCEKALHRLAFPPESGRDRKTVSSVLADLSLNENHHFEGKRDYFRQALERWAN